MARQEWKDKLNTKNVDDIMNEYNPIFMVTDDSVPQEIRDDMHKAQHQNMNYFVNTSGNEFSTNSAVLMAMLIAHGLVNEMQWDKYEYPRARIANGTTAHKMDEIVNKGMKEQVKLDKKQLFLCAVMNNDADEDELKNALEG